MLRYFAHGKIRWKTAMICNTRTNWEFYAVIKGRCAAVLHDGEKPALRERTLWVFAPECSHAWADDGRHGFHRIAFHFDSVPYPLDEIVREKGWFSKTLNEDEIQRLIGLAAQVEPHFRNPSLLSPLVFQGRLMDLCALALADQSASLPPALPDLAQLKVERALAWYGEHLARNPSVKETADAVHVSPSHLRRLFWQVRRTSPKSAFQRLRLEKANSLMGRSALTLDDVARLCGYSSASHFCRDYKRVHHFTPTYWRKRLVAGFSRPLPPGMVPVREFSARPEERTMSA